MSTKLLLYQELGPILSDIYLDLTSALDSFLAVYLQTLYVVIGTIVILTFQNFTNILKFFLKLIDQDVIDMLANSFKPSKDNLDVVSKVKRLLNEEI
ncbi:2657_t:CDS:2 [Gigaspora margarita]|uniref:2657_t:CDS:1 n=1 Tax=Gigaspora margarita TaxID=4874 RepID=A0ABN7UZC0_GIGMA|nr:2657_t:CDS:2 [Gigaspora margarita]